MGTISEWMWVLFLAAFWGAGMAWPTARLRAAAKARSAGRIGELILLAPFALCFGIGVEF
jgi:uncharacterized RDD family membrane protein YckC